MTDKWTSEMLRSAEGRAVHLQQRRAQLEPIVDDLRRIAREMRADLGEDERLYGDWPGEATLRARRTAAPLFKAVSDLEHVLEDLVVAGKRYERNYEALPAKREAKREAKQRAKDLKQGHRPEQIAPAGEDKPSGGGFIDLLSKGA